MRGQIVPCNDNFYLAIPDKLSGVILLTCGLFNGRSVILECRGIPCSLTCTSIPLSKQGAFGAANYLCSSV